MVHANKSFSRLTTAHSLLFSSMREIASVTCTRVSFVPPHVCPHAHTAMHSSDDEAPRTPCRTRRLFTAAISAEGAAFRGLASANTAKRVRLSSSRTHKNSEAEAASTGSRGLTGSSTTSEDVSPSVSLISSAGMSFSGSATLRCVRRIAKVAATRFVIRALSLEDNASDAGISGICVTHILTAKS